mgnify:CR=1 FL=1
MTNSLEAVYTAFFDRIEQDATFFRYFEVTEEEAMEIAKERSRSYLREACSFLRRNIPLDFTLSIVTDDTTGDEVFA